VVIAVIPNQESRHGARARGGCRAPRRHILATAARLIGATAVALALAAAAPRAATVAAAPSAAAVTTASIAAPGSSGAPAATGTRSQHGKHVDDARQTAPGDADSKDSNGQSGGPFSSLQFSSNKGPINIKSDSLDLDYKNNVVTFRGHVHATQADAVLTSDALMVTYGKDFQDVKEMVATNNVRMSQGTRWATGDRAVLDQATHTVTLTGGPVVHDGEDQVAGTKITVHLDTGKSEVDGARAVFFPKEQKTRDNKTTVAKSP
jgi:lipopolysaccharide export system protein LptA